MSSSLIFIGLLAGLPPTSGVVDAGGGGAPSARYSTDGVFGEKGKNGLVHRCPSLAEAAVEQQGVEPEGGGDWRRMWPSLSVTAWAEVLGRGQPRIDDERLLAAARFHTSHHGVSWSVSLTAKWRLFPEAGGDPGHIPVGSHSVFRRAGRGETELHSGLPVDRRVEEPDWAPWRTGPDHGIGVGTIPAGRRLDIVPRRPKVARRIYRRVLLLCRAYAARRRALLAVEPSTRSAQDLLFLDRTAALLEAYVGRSLHPRSSYGGHP